MPHHPRVTATRVATAMCLDVDARRLLALGMCCPQLRHNLHGLHARILRQGIWHLDLTGEWQHPSCCTETMDG